MSDWRIGSRKKKAKPEADTPSEYTEDHPELADEAPLPEKETKIIVPADAPESVTCDGCSKIIPKENSNYMDVKSAKLEKRWWFCKKSPACYMATQSKVNESHN
jgi:hypothetical protein